MKEKTTVFNGTGKVFDEQTGDIHQTESNRYKITITEFFVSA